MRRGAWLAAALPALALGIVPGAWAAKLVGGREQTALTRAFSAARAHRGQAIVSARASTVNPSWAVVTAVRPRSGSSRAPALLRAYFHIAGGRAQAGLPPQAARADLSSPFSVVVRYAGSGAETITYDQQYASICGGEGGFSDQQSDTVSPMSWSVRYLVDLDDPLAVTRTAAGTVIVPKVTFLAQGSSVHAREALTRTALDLGCGGTPTSYHCATTYGVGASASGLLQFPTRGGLQIGVPTSAKAIGQCDPSDYTLGPSLWDGGATTALAGQIGLVGGRLPSDPYAPVTVAWPSGSAAASTGFVASPCQGDGAACRDDFRWRGQVSLAPVSAG
ncbi:MAG: hypothetical protein JOZ07_00715 [Solirubrobacterales bacterium]|nr:hypothetical protein [Solirubrobacterales bacterium]